MMVDYVASNLLWMGLIAVSLGVLIVALAELLRE